MSDKTNGELGVSDWEILKTMYQEFGVRRCVELMGWAVLFGLAGIDDLKSLREYMEQQGLSERTAYRAAADFKRLKDALEAKVNRRVELAEVFEHVRQETAAKNGRTVVS